MWAAGGGGHYSMVSRLRANDQRNSGSSSNLVCNSLFCLRCTCLMIGTGYGANSIWAAGGGGFCSMVSDVRATAGANTLVCTISSRLPSCILTQPWCLRRGVTSQAQGMEATACGQLVKADIIAWSVAFVRMINAIAAAAAISSVAYCFVFVAHAL